jgi:hypothetical protein
VTDGIRGRDVEREALMRGLARDPTIEQHPAIRRTGSEMEIATIWTGESREKKRLYDNRNMVQEGLAVAVVAE